MLSLVGEERNAEDGHAKRRRKEEEEEEEDGHSRSKEEEEKEEYRMRGKCVPREEER